MGERESQTETAASVRAALDSLGKCDASMLLHRVQVRGWPPNPGFEDRALRIAESRRNGPFPTSGFEWSAMLPPREHRGRRAADKCASPAFVDGCAAVAPARRAAGSIAERKRERPILEAAERSSNVDDCLANLVKGQGIAKRFRTVSALSARVGVLWCYCQQQSQGLRGRL